MIKLDFFLNFRTNFGESVAVVGNLPALGNNDMAAALPLSFYNENLWHISIETETPDTDLVYRYVFIDTAGHRKMEAEKERIIRLNGKYGQIVLVDSWNDESFYENIFYTAPFTEVFFRNRKHRAGVKKLSRSHLLKVKAPLTGEKEAVCLLGSGDDLKNWETAEPLLLKRNGSWWTIAIDLQHLPVSYKYGIYDTAKKEFIRFEEGDNRILHAGAQPDVKTIVHDGFIRLPANTWRAAGVSIPVFSLRTNNGFGIGEFADIRLLVDWASAVGLKLIQLLPVNDTSATYTWRDSYPYAAISAFALHPVYISLNQVAGKKNRHIIKALSKKQKQLNSLATLDYEQVIHFKMNMLWELFELDGMSFLEEKEFGEFFEDNRDWLIPYAAFCYLRDKYGTSDYSQWKAYSRYDSREIEKLTAKKSRHFRQIAFFYFIQYHLHLQLREAAIYAHKNGVALKGDIPIGIYRYGADAWTAPDLYNMDMQAGAPPDDFAIKGQNWGFPTYNWKKMEEDHFEWWRLRFHQMSNYFDTFRIDHILGFFRIWSIPMDSVEGIMGRFIPALPVGMNEFGERGIWFEQDRFCRPYITDEVLTEVFGGNSAFVKEYFLEQRQSGYILKPGVDTQRKIEEYFALQEEFDQEDLKQGLFDLVSNVILFEEPIPDGTGYHFRILAENTSSFRHLDPATQGRLRDLYIDYFYRRQDDFWKDEAMHKLPALKEATHMMICGEDLGMVPHSVPEVMRELGILSLEIQRMPKDPATEFLHPAAAPYLSVITPSSHDMSTIRGWWEEDRERTQRFFNLILGEQGAAPYFCEAWVNRAIVLQHLYSPAMWSIFQLQDLLGMSEGLRRENPHEERINLPSNPSHYWNYRMHITLEQLIREKSFNHELRDYLVNSGRA